MSGESTPVLNYTLEQVKGAFLGRLRSLAARDQMDVAGYLSSSRGVDHTLGQQPQACVVDGFDVSEQAVPNMTVQMGVGLGFAPAVGSSGVVGSPQTNVDSNFVMLNKRVASTAIAIAASDPAQGRFDLIEVRPTASPATVGVDESQIVQVWDTSLQHYVPSSGAVTTMKHGEPDYVVTTGALGANGVPTPTFGRIPIAVIRVNPAATTITQADILDVRLFLSDLEMAQGESRSSLDVGELTMALATADTDPQTMSVQVEARVKGIPCAWQTHVPVDTIGNKGNYVHMSPADHVALGAYTGWVFCYLVASDDKGYRYSRSHIDNTEAPLEVPVNGDFSHCGVLVWSMTFPSLANGSLAPAAGITLPNMYGATTCGTFGGLGKAVCIGAAYWSGNKFTGGLRMFSGKAELLDRATAPVPTFASGSTVPSWVAETANNSEYYADWSTSALYTPKGALALDVRIAFVANNTSDAGSDRTFAFYAKAAASTTRRSLHAFENNTVRTPTGATGTYNLLATDVPVAVLPNARGSAPDGWMLDVDTYGATATGHGLVDPAGTPPVLQLTGYRWPQGSIVV